MSEVAVGKFTKWQKTDGLLEGKASEVYQTYVNKNMINSKFFNAKYYSEQLVSGKNYVFLGEVYNSLEFEGLAILSYYENLDGEISNVKFTPIGRELGLIGGFSKFQKADDLVTEVASIVFQEFVNENRINSKSFQAKYYSAQVVNGMNFIVIGEEYNSLEFDSLNILSFYKSLDGKFDHVKYTEFTVDAIL